MANMSRVQGGVGIRMENGAVRIEAALLVTNRPSGRGRTPEEIDHLGSAFHDCFDRIGHRVARVTKDHAEVVTVTRDFLASAQGPCFLLTAGGGGTTRALVQGVFEMAEAGLVRLDEVRFSSLRLGSGNLIPQYFGMSAAPLTALRGIARQLFAGRTRACCVFCCNFYYPDGRTRRVYGVTMGGMGQFGRVPDDIQHWRNHHPRLMRWMMRWMPLERVNTVQYLGFSVLRTLRCIAQPRRAEWIEVRHAGRSELYQLIAGLLLNFDFPQVPFRGGCDIHEPRLMLCLVPYLGRGRTGWALLDWQHLERRVIRYEITPETPVEILFPRSSSTTLALDEDTFLAPPRIDFRLAGSLRFVTDA
jgi:hypothetical protein